MTIEFKEEQIMDKESLLYEPYVGYFSPKGELIDFNTALFEGTGHDTYKNPVSIAFLSFVSYALKDSSVIEKIKNAKNEEYKKALEQGIYPGLEEVVLTGFSSFNYRFGLQTDFTKRLKMLDDVIKQREKLAYNPVIEFELGMLKFLQIAHFNGTFFDTIQRLIQVESYKEIEREIKEWQAYPDYMQGELEKAVVYEAVCRLLSYMKDICVQYLGYDSLERFMPNGNKISIPDKYSNFDFLGTPRIITSSHLDINERFYNYLLMGWSVHQLPRYYFDDKTKRFEISELNGYESDKELRLGEEITSIKRSIPLRERKKYFR